MACLSVLPTELLVEVFSNLDYTALHCNVRPVCRRFDAIITSIRVGTLVVKLHRSRETYETHETDESEYYFALHPCLRKLVVDFSPLSCSSSITIDNIGFLNEVNGIFTPIGCTKLAEEMALSPGLPADDFFYEQPRHDFLRCLGRRTDNITVRHFAEELVAGLEDQPNDYREDILSGCDDTGYGVLLDTLSNWELYHRGKSDEAQFTYIWGDTLTKLAEPGGCLEGREPRVIMASSLRYQKIRYIGGKGDDGHRNRLC